jgi:streptogramin lyase
MKSLQLHSVSRSTPVRVALSAAALAAFSLITGCGLPVSAPSPVSSSGLISGKVYGGQQPISGASIVLYAAGTTGNRTGSINLLRTPAFTTADGNFSITGDYTCPSSATQVYLVARGGNPGLSPGTTNPASVMMVALGDCGNLTSSSFVNVNEVTTVASAWALSQFLGLNANVGSTATNVTGLRNAFLVANNLVNVASGLAGGASLPAGTTIESAKMYSLANILATCVNSNGGTACNPLFNAAKVRAIAPANTLDAALNIVQNPGSNVLDVFNVGSPQGPFQPVLKTVPSDWTMSITYTGGGIAAPTAIALDSTGSIWVANYFGGSATKLSATGVPASATGFADPALRESYGLTVDGQDNAWITNEESSSQVNHGGGSITKFSSTGQLLSGAGFTAGGIYFPYALAADSNGSIWVSDYGRSTATLLASDGTSLGGANGYSSSKLALPVAVAIDGSHNAWFAGEGSASRVTPTGTIDQFSCCRGPSAIAIDQTGSVWVSDYSASALVQLGSDGAVLQNLVMNGGLYYPEGLAIDGAGAVWVSNYRGNTLSAFGHANPGSHSPTLSPSSGFGVDASLSQPFGIALDASGNVWVANFASSSLTQFVGMASPIRTPLLGPPGTP